MEEPRNPRRGIGEDDNVKARKLRRLNDLDDDALYKEIPALILLIRHGPREVVWKVLDYVNIVTIHRMCQMNPNFQDACGDIWQEYFRKQFPTERQFERATHFVQVIRSVTREPTLLGKPEEPINWLWVNLVWYGVGILDQVSLVERDDTREILMRLPTDMMKVGESEWRYHVSIQVSTYSVLNPVTEATLKHYRSIDPSMRPKRKGMYVSIDVDTFIPRHVAARIGYYVFRYADALDQVFFDQTGLTKIDRYDPDNMARMLYAMLRDGYSYVMRTRNDTGEIVDPDSMLSADTTYHNIRTCIQCKEKRAEWQVKNQYALRFCARSCFEEYIRNSR